MLLTPFQWRFGKFSVKRFTATIVLLKSAEITNFTGITEINN